MLINICKIRVSLSDVRVVVALGVDWAVTAALEGPETDNAVAVASPTFALLQLRPTGRTWLSAQLLQNTGAGMMNKDETH